MKKFLLTAMALLTIASATVFGMYGKGDDGWIDFLVHGNQFRARMDQLGFVLGNDTIKGTFGLFDNQGYIGSIINSTTTKTDNTIKDTFFYPTLSAGLAYTSDIIGVGVGYNFTYIDTNLQVHTPVLMINALNNNLRIAVPIQVAVSDKAGRRSVSGDPNLGGASMNIKYTGVAFNNIQLRYYTGIDAFNAIRLYAYYRNNTADITEGGVNNKYTSESLGFQARFYFLRTQIGEVTVNPFIRLEYHAALKGDSMRAYTAEYAYVNNVMDSGLSANQKQSDIYSVVPYEFVLKPVLSLAANSDFVRLYVEPSLGYSVSGYKTKAAANNGNVSSITHALAWGAYTELYITPVKDLEFYFEMDINGKWAPGGAGAGAGAGYLDGGSLAPISFDTGCGLTWYLPAL